MTQPYLSLEAELHDLFWQEDDDGSEVRLMSRFLDRNPGRALEIGCGSGRLLLPLLRAGFPIEGLELSPDMLALCRNRAVHEGLAPVLHEADMGRWMPERKFASLLAPAFTLQLSADPAATLRHWHSWLEPGGALYLTTFIPFAELEGDEPENEWHHDRSVALPGGGSASLETRYRIEPDAQVLHREHRYRTSDGGEHHSRQTIRWFEEGELEALLESCGFTVTEAFADFNPGLALDAIDPLETDGIRTHYAVPGG